MPTAHRMRDRLHDEPDLHLFTQSFSILYSPLSRCKTHSVLTARGIQRHMSTIHLFYIFRDLRINSIRAHVLKNEMKNVLREESTMQLPLIFLPNHLCFLTMKSTYVHRSSDEE